MWPRWFLLRVLVLALSLVGCSSLEHPPLPQESTDRTEPLPSGTVAVSPSGAPAAAETPEPANDRGGDSIRLYALRRHVWIRERPSSRARWLGYLGLGGSVRVTGEPVSGDGCPAFYPIEPRGFVCLDDKATLDPKNDAYQAVARIAPQLDSPWLHQYGEARESPRYPTIPSTAQQAIREFGLERHLLVVDALQRNAFEGELPPLLKGVDVTRAGTGPPQWLQALPVVHEFRDRAPHGSAVSFAASFDAEGRTWLVTGDGALVPKDKIAPYPRSEFHGVKLDGEVRLPIAFVRERARPRYVQRADGAVEQADGVWERLAFTQLTGRVVESGRRRFLETAEKPFLLEERDAVVVRASSVTPWGDRVESSQPVEGRRWPVSGNSPARGGRETWIEASVHEGWLIAYEGVRPVYATLAASGRGDPVGKSGFVQTSTATGVFRIQGKYWTETMGIGATTHFDVPFTLPYHNSYALHAAYWHDRWGEKVSLGCLNLSPTDARWLFIWAEPNIPEGWHGMKTDGNADYATVVIVHA